MDSLPLEIWYEIFKYLRLKSIFELRSVSKMMNERVKSYKVTEIVFNQRNLFYDYKLNDNWAFINVRINRKNIIDCLNSSFEVSSSFNGDNLKFLRIANVKGNAKISVNFLNKLIKLEQLQVHYNKLNVDDKLSLPNLTVLSIKSSIQIIMKIDSINLKKLSLEYDTFERTEFENADKITHLSINNHDKNILKFSKLEYYEFNTANNLPDDLLECLPFLKRIRINFHCFNEVNMLKNILNKKTSLGRQDLQVSYKGLILISNQELNLLSKFRNRLLLQVSNYSILTDHLPCEFKIFYNDLIGFKITEIFFKKYNNIQIIEINQKIDDMKSLIEFLKNCKTLNELCIYNAGFDQLFFDSLSKISCLIILRVFDDQNLNLRLDFVAEMEYLEQLNSNQSFDTECLKHLENLKEFSLEIDNCRINSVRLNKKYQIKSSNLDLVQRVDKILNGSS